MSDAATKNDTPESSSEIFVEDGVNNRIQSWVDVAKPEGKGEPPRLDVAAFAQRCQQVKEEER